VKVREGDSVGYTEVKHKENKMVERKGKTNWETYWRKRSGEKMGNGKGRKGGTKWEGQESKPGERVEKDKG